MNISVCIVKVENNIGGKKTTVVDWILGSAKKRQSSKKGRRPSSSSNIPALKYPRILEDEGKVCFCSSFFLCIMYIYNRLSGEDVFQSVIQAARKKFNYSPNRSRTYEVLVTGPDALPLSYRRLVVGKVTKLGSRDKHAEYC